MKYLVTASEAEPKIVDESELRNTVHALFCSCADGANCDNECLAELDQLLPGELAQDGYGWDLEDGWVDIEPVKQECNQWRKGRKCVLPAGHKGSHMVEWVERDEPVRLTWGPEPEEGTCACPICGVDSPHEHTSEEIAQFRCR